MRAPRPLATCRSLLVPQRRWLGGHPGAHGPNHKERILEAPSFPALQTWLLLALKDLGFPGNQAQSCLCC